MIAQTDDQKARALLALAARVRHIRRGTYVCPSQTEAQVWWPIILTVGLDGAERLVCACPVGQMGRRCNHVRATEVRRTQDAARPKTPAPQPAARPVSVWEPQRPGATPGPRRVALV